MAERRRIVPALAALVAAGALGTYLYVNRRYAIETFSLEPRAIVSLAALCFATMVLRASLNRAFFRPLDVHASWRAWFELMSVATFSNYLPLATGLVAKGLYLKRVHSLPVRRFAVGQGALLALVIAANGALGLVALWIVPPAQGSLAIGLLFAAMASLALPLAAPSLWVHRLPEAWQPWPPERSGAVLGAWPIATLLQVGVLLALAWSLQIALGLGGHEIGLATAVLLAAGAVLSRLVALAPGALGVRELMIGGVAAIIGLPLRDAIIASSLVRAVEVVVVMLLGALFSYRVTQSFADGEGAPDRTR